MAEGENDYELESDTEVITTSDTELEANESSSGSNVSLLGKLRAPRLSDLSRKRAAKRILHGT